MNNYGSARHQVYHQGPTQPPKPTQSGLMSWTESITASVKNLPNHGRTAAAYWDSMSDTQKKYVIAGACSVGLVFFGWSLTKIAKKFTGKEQEKPITPLPSKKPTKQSIPTKRVTKGKSKPSIPSVQAGSIEIEKRTPTLEEALAIAEEVIREEKLALLGVQQKLSESILAAVAKESETLRNNFGQVSEDSYQKTGAEVSIVSHSSLEKPVEDPPDKTPVLNKVLPIAADPEDDLALQTTEAKNIETNYLPTTGSSTFATPKRYDSDEPTATAGFDYDWSTDITKEEESIGLSDYSMLGSEIGPGKLGVFSQMGTEHGGEQLRRCLSDLIRAPRNANQGSQIPQLLPIELIQANNMSPAAFDDGNLVHRALQVEALDDDLLRPYFQTLGNQFYENEGFMAPPTLGRGHPAEVNQAGNNMHLEEQIEHYWFQQQRIEQYMAHDQQQKFHDRGDYEEAFQGNPYDRLPHPNVKSQGGVPNASQTYTPGGSSTSVSMLVHAGSAHSGATKTDPEESSDGATLETPVKQGQILESMISSEDPSTAEEKCEIIESCDLVVETSGSVNQTFSVPPGAKRGLVASAEDMLLDDEREETDFSVLPSRKTKSLPLADVTKEFDKAEDFTAATTSHAMASTGLGCQTDIDQLEGPRITIPCVNDATDGSISKIINSTEDPAAVVGSTSTVQRRRKAFSNIVKRMEHLEKSMTTATPSQQKFLAEDISHIKDEMNLLQKTLVKPNSKRKARSQHPPRRHIVSFHKGRIRSTRTLSRKFKRRPTASCNRKHLTSASMPIFGRAQSCYNDEAVPDVKVIAIKLPVFEEFKNEDMKAAGDLSEDGSSLSTRYLTSDSFRDSSSCNEMLLASASHQAFIMQATEVLKRRVSFEDCYLLDGEEYPPPDGQNDVRMPLTLETMNPDIDSRMMSPGISKIHPDFFVTASELSVGEDEFDSPKGIQAPTSVVLCRKTDQEAELTELQCQMLLDAAANTSVSYSSKTIAIAEETLSHSTRETCEKTAPDSTFADTQAFDENFDDATFAGQLCEFSHEMGENLQVVKEAEKPAINQELRASQSPAEELVRATPEKVLSPEVVHPILTAASTRETPQRIMFSKPMVQESPAGIGKKPAAATNITKAASPGPSKNIGKPSMAMGAGEKKGDGKPKQATKVAPLLKEKSPGPNKSTTPKAKPLAMQRGPGGDAGIRLKPPMATAQPKRGTPGPAAKPPVKATAEQANTAIKRKPVAKIPVPQAKPAQMARKSKSPAPTPSGVQKKAAPAKAPAAKPAPGKTLAGKKLVVGQKAAAK